MRLLLSALDQLGGLASKRELNSFGVPSRLIDLAAWYGRDLIRVRNGWFARPGEPSDVLRAWRIGGRLTCVSAWVLHGELAPTAVLHIEVPANTARLHDPDRRRLLLPDDAAVVVHWTRHPGPGDRRSVSAEHAEAVAAGCGVRSAGAVAGGRAAGYAAASSEWASRMV